MRKTLATIITIVCFIATLVFFAACGASSTPSTQSNVKQTASAWVSNDGAEAYATVDLTGGWSVKFASGAIYMYNKEVKKNTEAVAMCITLDKDVYDEYLEAAPGKENYKELDNAIYYEDDGSAYYFFKYGKNVYLMIDAKDKALAEDVFNRLSFGEGLS